MISPSLFLKRLARAGLRKLASGFDAASTTIARIANWRPTNTELTTLLLREGGLLRARSRKLYRENSFARGAVNTFVSNCIGTGIVPRSLHPDEAMRKRIDESFYRWTKECDADGRKDFYGMQAAVTRAMRVDGEVFVRQRFRYSTDGFHVPLQLQLLEADFVPYFKSDMSATGYTRAGISFNNFGQRTSYWMYRDHPGSDFVRDAQLYEVSADQVFHVFEETRPGQLRGEPYLTPIIIMLYDIKQMMDATLVRQKVTTLLSVWIQKIASTKEFFNSDDVTLAKNSAGKTVEHLALEAGGVHYLEEGEEPHFMTPSEPGTSFSEFVNTMLRACAKALGLTFEQFTGDLSRVNFSSIRAGMLEFKRWMRAFQQQVIAFQFCEQLWPVWMAQAILSGALGPDAAIAYRKKPEDFLAVRWDPQGWDWTNPTEDIAAAKAAVRAGFRSRSIVVAETGENSEDIDAENAADNERADELGLKYDSDGRNPDKGPTVTEAAVVPGDDPGLQQDPPPEPTPAKKKGKP